MQLMDLTPYVEATYDIDQPGWGHFYPHLTQTHSPMDTHRRAGRN